MSVLGIDEVIRRIKKEKLIEGVGQRELKNPEGVSIDLRLGAIYKIIQGGAFIEADGQATLGKRKGVKVKLVAKYKPRAKKQEWVNIKHGDYYLVSTIEWINTPKDLLPVLFTRTTLFRAGLLLINSKVQPGYKGTLAMGLINLSPFEVKLQPGVRICDIVFYKIEGKTVEYRGQHQGGRISSHEEEQQV